MPGFIGCKLRRGKARLSLSTVTTPASDAKLTDERGSIPQSDLPNLFHRSSLRYQRCWPFALEVTSTISGPCGTAPGDTYHSPEDNPISPVTDLPLSSIPVRRSREREMYGVLRILPLDSKRVLPFVHQLISIHIQFD